MSHLQIEHVSAAACLGMFRACVSAAACLCFTPMQINDANSWRKILLGGFSYTFEIKFYLCASKIISFLSYRFDEDNFNEILKSGLKLLTNRILQVWKGTK